MRIYAEIAREIQKVEYILPIMAYSLTASQCLWTTRRSKAFSVGWSPPRLHSKTNPFSAVDYRLTSESGHPAQLLDALAAYAYLVGNLGIASFS
jgi:hypothetical protein